MTDSNQILIIGCGIFAKEIDFVISKNKWPVKTIMIDSINHMDFEKLHKDLEAELLKYKEERVVVFYGACHPLIHKTLERFQTIRTQGQNCIDIILGSKLFNEELANGAFFLSEDWIMRWKDIVTAGFGTDKEVVREIFKSSHTYLNAIKTPCSFDFEAQAKEVSEFLDLELKWLKVDLKELELNLQQTIAAKTGFHLPINAYVTIPQEEYMSYQERLKNMAFKKASLEYTHSYYEKIASAHNFEEIIKVILNETMALIGGEKIELYIKNENKYKYHEINSLNIDVDSIPEEIEQVFMNGKFLAYSPKIPNNTNQPNWIFPLNIGNRTIGAVHMIGMFFNDNHFKLDLELVFKFAALMINNELGTYEKLRNAYDEISNLNQTLEAKVLEKTKHLEEVNKELEAFSYSVSHDLRAPLRHISGFAEVLKEDYKDKLNEQGQMYLQKINSATFKMYTIIDDLLNLSRVSQVSIAKTQLNLADVVNAILLRLNESDVKKVKITVAENLLTICDRALIEIALENLISNAIKYSSKQDAPVVSIYKTTKDNKDVFVIADNGAGFDMQFKNKLFQTFSRLHSNKEFAGTGIGLAIVNRIIARHGGSIWAEAEVGQGAKFFFTL